MYNFAVGDIPDMIQPIKNCSKVLVAIEAEPYADTVNARLVDNPGGVGIITFTDTPTGTYNYTVLDFNKFNSVYVYAVDFVNMALLHMLYI